jgi:competence protein ComEC
MDVSASFRPCAFFVTSAIHVRGCRSLAEKPPFRKCRIDHVRLILWTASVALGDAIALLSDASVRFVIAWVGLLLIVAIFLVRNRRRLFAEGIVALALGAYAGARATHPLPLPPPLAGLIDTDGRAMVQGWVLSAPEAADGGGSRLRVVVQRVGKVPAHATIALAVATGVPDLLPGDVVRFVARLRSVRGLANPGVADSVIQIRAGGVDLYAGVHDNSAIDLVHDPEADLGAPAFALVIRWAARVHRALGCAINGVVSGRPAAFLHTAVLGERRGNDASVEDGFRAAGATHVLSVSGLHLAAIAAVFFAGARRLLCAVPRLPLWVEPRATAALVALPPIAFYTLVTGSAIATVRSALMMGFGLLGIAIGRPSSPLVAIAAAVLVLLAWTPAVLVDISFQLSVVSVLALALLVPGLAPHSRFDGRPNGWRKRVARWAVRFGAATSAAGLTTAPLVAHHFGEVTPAAPVGNLLLVPLVEMVVVPLGLAGAVLGATLGRMWGWPLLTVAGWASRTSLGIAELFRAHAPVWLTRSPNSFETAALVFGIAAALASIGPSKSWRRVTGIMGLLVIIGGAGSMGVRELRRRWDPNLVVTFLDVGQGDSAVIQIPGGQTLLIDGGGTYDGSFDPGQRVIEPFLRGRGITRLDAIALSHPHPDHLGGLHRILARFPVGLLWTSGDDGHNPDYLRLVAEARARGVPLPIPTSWAARGALVEPLGPFVSDPVLGGGEHIGPPEGTTVNDGSLILRMVFGGRSVLFTGDIEANGEGELTGRTGVGQTVASDVLKVPHHGSRTSSSTELLDCVRPRIAVMSLGWRNRFNFPRPEIVQRYRARGIQLLRTDLNGAVTVTITPEGGLYATCELGCR